MKKTKKGFTLAEVLTALAVTGVIAAFVIPQFGSSIQKAKTGLTLARTVEQIETGAQNYLQASNEKANDGSINTLISQIPNVNVKTLATYIGMTEKTDVTFSNDMYKQISFESLLMPAAYAISLEGLPGVQVGGDVGFNDPCNPSAADVPSSGDDIDPNQFMQHLALGCSGGGSGSGSGSGSDDGDDDNKVETPGVKLPDPCELRPFLPACRGGKTPNEPIPDPCETNPNLPECQPEDPCKTNPDSPECKEPEPEPDKNINVPRMFINGKNGASIIFGSAINTGATTSNAVIVSIVIDTNGQSRKPNVYGKDAFVFFLNNSGKMVPYGKKEDCADGNIKNSMSCTARVVADGYKIKY